MLEHHEPHLRPEYLRQIRKRTKELSQNEQKIRVAEEVIRSILSESRGEYFTLEHLANLVAVTFGVEGLLTQENFTQNITHWAIKRLLNSGSVEEIQQHDDVAIRLKKA